MAAQRKAAAALPDFRPVNRTTSGSAAPPSKKRKMDPGEQKYYAVRAGKKPGVYTRWVDCQLQISGFKGAQFKSFTSIEDASAWAAGRNISNAEPTRFYGVARGKKPGVYTDWTVCQQQIVGFKGPKYKRFDSLREAEQFVRTWNNPATQPLNAQPKEEGDDDEEEEDDDEEEDEGGELEELAVVEDDFLGLGDGPSKKLKTMQSGSNSGICIIYSDGSSLSNGMLGARAGAGVYFGPGDPRNVSERLKGEVQTNQRGELTGILRALEMAGNAQAVEIRTDSRYSIQCTTEWYVGWDKNGWLTRTGDDVKNSDLIRAIRARMDARDALGTYTRLQWVKGHASDPGNIAADQLAREGAAKPF